MKHPALFSIMSILVLALPASVAQATVSLGYSYEQLNNLWTTLGAPQNLFSEIKTADIVRKAPVKADGNSSTVCKANRPCNKATKTGGAQGQTDLEVAFDIIIQTGNIASTVYTRQALLDLYLAKSAEFNQNFFTPQELETLTIEAQTAERITRNTAMTQRDLSATFELYMLNLLQYYAQEEIPAKCRAIKSADTIYAQAMQDRDISVDLLPQWATLYNEYLSTITRFQTSPDHLLACEVIPSSSRAQAVTKVREIVTSQIETKLNEKVDETVQLIDTASVVSDCAAVLAAPTDKNEKDGDKQNASALQKLHCMRLKLEDIKPRIEQVLTLARDVKNVKGNLDFIEAGAPGVRALQQKLFREAALDSAGRPIPHAEPFPKLKNATVLHDDIKALIAEDNAIWTNLKWTMASVEGLSRAVSGPGVGTCILAKTQYDDLERLKEKAGEIAINTLVGQVGVCLGDLNTELTRLIVATDADRARARFAEDVKKLSDEVLSRVKADAQRM